MKITVSRQELMVALLFVSTDESRFVINGLCLTYRPRRKPLIVATDGRRLCVIESTADQDDGGAEINERQITLSAQFVKPLCALNKALDTSEGKIFPLITIENKEGSNRVGVGVYGDRVFLEAETGAIIEGKYPNWKQIVPSKREPREPVSKLGMNAAFVADFAKAAKLFERDVPQIQMSLVGADKVIEIAIPGVPNFFGLFMPIKADDSTEFQPKFLDIVDQLPKPAVEKPPIKTAEEELASEPA